MRERFVRAIQSNAVVSEILARLPDLAIPDAWLAGGCLFQTVWNVLRGDTPSRGIKDYDVFYFDAGDRSKAAEARINQKAALLSADLGCEVEMRNQARVHDLYAPFGVDDVFNLITRPNPSFPILPRDRYELKAKRWQQLWPELRVVPLDGGCIG